VDDELKLTEFVRVRDGVCSSGDVDLERDNTKPYGFSSCGASFITLSCAIRYVKESIDFPSIGDGSLAPCKKLFISCPSESSFKIVVDRTKFLVNGSYCL